MLTPQQRIEQDVHKDIDMHADWMTSVAYGDILEIGVRTGISTASFLRGLEQKYGHLYSCDNNPACSDVFAGHKQWTFICADSKNTDFVIPKIPSQLDTLFIDGDHTYEGVKADLNNYAPLVKSGGRIILHDVCSGYDPGVRQAFDEFIEQTGYEAEIFESWVGLGQVLVP
jgi:predicted O-methyltransferase YrrM